MNMFETFRKFCKFYSVSFDSYKGVWEDACHNNANCPNGSSWGECKKGLCPIIKEVHSDD